MIIVVLIGMYCSSRFCPPAGLNPCNFLLKVIVFILTEQFLIDFWNLTYRNVSVTLLLLRTLSVNTPQKPF